MFKQFHKARVASSVVSDTDSLIGFTDISKEDQTQLRNLILSENVSRNKVLPSSLNKRKQRVSPDAPLHVRKAKLKSSNNESLNILYTNADQLTTTKMAELRLRIQQEKPRLLQCVKLNQKMEKIVTTTKSQDSPSTR